MSNVICGQSIRLSGLILYKDQTMAEPLLEAETAIVTGGSSGIGRAIAMKFAEEGANVVIADINKKSGKATVDECNSLPGTVEFIKTDITSRSQVKSLVSTTVDWFGGLDILVNNAGGSINDGNLHQISGETWDQNIDINLKGTFNCSQISLAPMIESGGGRMVHISSVNGVTGIGLSAYSAAKSGILGLSRLIATQYGNFGIRSNVICPGTVATESRNREMASKSSDSVKQNWIDQYALGRFGTPEEVADAAVYLGSSMSSFVTGTELLVDGGLSSGVSQRLQREVYNVDMEPL